MLASACSLAAPRCVPMRCVVCPCLLLAGTCKGAAGCGPVRRGPVSLLSPGFLQHPLPSIARPKVTALGRRHYLAVPAIAIQTWFEGRRFPLDVGVAFWLDGAPAEPRVASRLTANGVLGAGLRTTIRRLAGRTVSGLRLAAAGTDGGSGGVVPAEVDVLLTSATRGGGASGGVGGRNSGGGSGGGAQAARAAAGPAPLGQPKAAAAPTPATRPTAAVQQPGSGTSLVPAPAAAAGPPRPAAPMPAGTARGVGAALRALQLPDIAPPPAVVTAGDALAAAALEDAAQAVFDQAGRVADALGLSAAAADKVLAGVATATAAAGPCRRFVGMEYSRLRRACDAGDEDTARGWCERVAVAGRSAA
jgi:hypothetical protein